MSRKSRGKAKLKGPKREAPGQAIPEEVLAEGSGPVSGAAIHVGHVGVDPIGGEAEELVAAADEALRRHRTGDEPPAETEAEAVELAAEPAVDDDAGVESDPVEAAPAEEGVTEEGGVAAAGDDADAEAVEEGAELAATLPTSAATMDATQLKHLVEALVFASDKPITVMRLRQLTRISDTRRLEQALAELATDYAERGLILQQVSGGYQFRTRTQFSAWVQQLIAGRPVRLSRAQLETLAIIAYRQPITRPEIDEIRGVDSSQTLKLLIDRALIRILGKREEVGRPMLYGTTKEFLDFFSLGDLRELPTLREYSELTDESRQVMSDRLGIGLDDDDSDGGSDPDDSGGSGGGGSGGSGGGGIEPGEAVGSGGEQSLDDFLASYSESVPGAGEVDAAALDDEANAPSDAEPRAAHDGLSSAAASVEESETQWPSESDPAAEAASMADADTESASDADTETASDADTESESDTMSASDADTMWPSATAADADREAASDAGTMSASESEPALDMGMMSASESEPALDMGMMSASESETDTSASGSEPALDMGMMSASESETVSASESESETVSASQPDAAFLATAADPDAVAESEWPEGSGRFVDLDRAGDDPASESIDAVVAAEAQPISDSTTESPLE